MEIRKISDGLSVSPQISVGDVKALVKEGFRTIICNRPDGESADQTPFGEIEAAAKQAGLEFANIPVVGGGLRQSDIVEFGNALRDLPGPVFAYCRSGTRSTILWSLYEASRGTAKADILRAAGAAGYDVSGALPVNPRVASRA